MSAAGAVGLIGVGALGMAMAERLIAAGHPVLGYRRGSLEAFRAIGGTAAPSAKATAAADPLLLLLPSDDALATIMTQIDAALRPNQLVLCLGTQRIAAKAEAARQAEQSGAVFVEGEVSGTPEMMRSGQASIMLAGAPDAFDRARAVLADCARAVSHVGAFGNAARMKLITNYLVGVHTMAAAEAIRLGQSLGLDARCMVDTIAASAGGSTMLAVRGRMMAEGAYPAGDIRGFLRFFDLLREALAEAGRNEARLLEFTEARYRETIAAGHGHDDIAAIFEAS